MSCFKFNSNDNENVNNDADEIILPEGFISWAGRNGEQQLLELMNFPISENFVYAENVSFCCGDDGKIIDRKIRQYLNSCDAYHKNMHRYHYRRSTPICYIRYNDITFLMAKPDTVMTRYTADNMHGILLYTDGELFYDLLDSYIFHCDGSKKYIKPKLYPDTQKYKMSFSHYVLRKFGVAVYGGKVVHHEDNRRNNVSRCLGLLENRDHINCHIQLRKEGRMMNGDDYMKWIQNLWGLSEDEICTFEQNLKLIIQTLPYFKGIDISDKVDLTKDIGYMSLKQLMEYLIVY